MITKNKDLNTRENTQQNAIRIIKECIKNNDSFILYTTGNQDVVSSDSKHLPVILGSFMLNLMEMHQDNPKSGMSEEDILWTLSIAKKYLNNANKKKNDNKNIDDDISSVETYIKKVLDDLKKQIENM